MKKKQFFVKRLFVIGVVLLSTTFNLHSQSLQTRRTYYDWQCSRIHEVFTVITGTNKMHGTYKKYSQYGGLYVIANYKNGLLHGKHTTYDGNPQERIQCSTNYLNGKKNGAEIIYDSDGKYPIKVTVYKEDEPIEQTKYFANNKKKSHTKLIGDKQQTTIWYENGIIEYDGILQVTVGNYGDITTPLKYIQQNKSGQIIEKLEDGIVYNYSDDGKVLLKKENLNTGLLEEFEENGNRSKTIQKKSENGSEYYTITLYKDNESYSTKTYDKNGNDLEVLKAREQAIQQYDSLYNVLNQKSPIDIAYQICNLKDYAETPTNLPIYQYRTSRDRESVIDRAIRRMKQIIDENAKQRLRFQNFDFSNEAHNPQNGVEEITKYLKGNVNLTEQYNTYSNMLNVAEQLVRNIYLIEANYIEAVLEERGYNCTFQPKVHSKMYSSYEEVVKYLENKISQENIELSELSNYINQYCIISKKVIKWYPKKISPINKALKKATSVEEKIKVFLTQDVE
ncbi:toxin-antitoxin system YwqK family antitoxin [Paraprevotella xylaniphila]|uniref:toxin-antitoxin system YwqK family antitoxin n=1 Tax=Paraprevotella xylaniphila TaxID=454155 RepID=UPI0024A88417|nr:hypothetical protein [Paraprevotella xylaniphila]